MNRLYYRVSTDLQDFDAQDNGVQRLLKEYKINPSECVRYQDFAISGTTTERPDYKRLMNDVEPDDTIITFEMSRLWRDSEEQGRAMKLFIKNRIRVLATDDTFEGFNDFLSVGIKGIINEYEAGRIKRRAREGIQAAQAKVAAGDVDAWPGRGRDKKPRSKEGYLKRWAMKRGEL